MRGAARTGPLDKKRAFSEAEWQWVRGIADSLETEFDWTGPAAARLRFVLDFCYGTGLRASEFSTSTLGSLETDSNADSWIQVDGKGRRSGKVALPPLARHALDRYLIERGIPVSQRLWNPETPILGRIESDSLQQLSTSRLWGIVKKFFETAATAAQILDPSLASRLRQASPHWMRHTHASHALASGAEITTVRDNLRHASISTTSVYLQGEDLRRARQMGVAFPRGPRQ